jgi:hypothetical protein
LPTHEVSPRGQRGSTRQSGSSVQENFDDRFLPTSPQAGNEGDLGNIHVSPNDQSLDSQANNDVASEVLADNYENDNKHNVALEVLADNYENDNEERSSKTLPVNYSQEKHQSSTASNSKTSMADSSGHPSDDSKKASCAADLSSIDEMSSSDDSSEDSSDDCNEGARSATTPGHGKILAFQSR